MHEIIVFRLLTQIVVKYTWKKTLEKTEGEIKNAQSRETGNIGYQRHKNKDKQTNKNATQYVLDTTIRKQIQIT